MVKNNSSSSSKRFVSREEREFKRFLRDLSNLRETLSYGFSDEGFGKASFLYRMVDKHLDPYESNQLGEAFRDVFTQPHAIDQVDNAINQILVRVGVEAP